MYIGLPIGERIHKVAAWNKLLDRSCDRISLWKSRMLLIGGRLRLVKSVLGSLSIYYLSLFKMHVAVYRKLEGIWTRFSWGAEGDQYRVLQWVNWDVILNDKRFGGLGVGSLAAFNQALIYKWRWRFLNGENLCWFRLVKSCYRNDRGFSLFSSNFKKKIFGRGS